MVDSATLDTPLAAFVAGVVTSFHCVGMCGPLSCAFAQGCLRNTAPFSFFYQSTRILSYAMLGGFAGLIGRPAVGFLVQGPSVILPWLLAAVFVMIAFGWANRLPVPRGLRSLMNKIQMLPPIWRGASLGAITPFLPCGPLYLLFGVALASGSTAAGALFLLSFGVGTLPVYATGQILATRFHSRLSPKKLMLFQRSLAGLSAGILLWRAFMNTGIGMTCCRLALGE